MATAKQERERAARGEGPLGKAHDDEPVFILRGQDCLSVELVDRWASKAHAIGVNQDKVKEAMAISDQMAEWPNRKPD